MCASTWLGYDLHFLRGQPRHGLCQPRVFLSEMSAPSLAYFLIGLIVLMSSFNSLKYILDKSPLSDV